MESYMCREGGEGAGAAWKQNNPWRVGGVSILQANNIPFIDHSPKFKNLITAWQTWNFSKINRVI